ncbi:FAD-binding oxidoreductase [Motiliproteus sp. MSK22-1]|uniref:NAD(P)/FAD-dependent oxidoreductase n=1 Tax=Motiliproteus sp. MSK22-1 TaxID=1897630 RepID=UPI00097632AE|nr:FAD-dependent oxidoreductase [Motiliproteus sp. MSK22-1]OMH39247.1 FAD-dependent oxidoreductase [Motiliproteus sp. MSK22-1]
MAVCNLADRCEADVAIIGGGLVGLAVATGLIKKNLKVVIFDEADVAFRASRGNFGLVWVQGKGDTCPEYAKLSRLSASLWPELGAELSGSTGIDVQLEQQGGLFFCLTEQELEQRVQMLEAMKQQHQGDYPFEVLDNAALKALVPEIGPTVAGATFGPLDGHVNPLLMMRALTKNFLAKGGCLVNCGPVEQLEAHSKGFGIQSGDQCWQVDKVVLAAGLGNKQLAPQLGLDAPVEPNRGQVLIAERVSPFLKFPTSHIRQTNEGTIQCGDSKEDVGLNEGTSIEVMAQIAKRAVTLFPLLEQAQLVRAWGALRIMTPDGYPVYQESESHSGAYLVTCHSGVTLAAAHAGPVADWIAGEGFNLDFSMEVFHANRFQL